MITWCYSYFSQRWLYFEMYKLLELSNEEECVWYNRINYYSLKEIQKSIKVIEERRQKLVKWILTAPSNSLIPWDFYDIWTQRHLITRSTGIPFSDEYPGIEYIEATQPIITSQLEAGGPVLKYNKSLYNLVATKPD